MSLKLTSNISIYGKSAVEAANDYMIRVVSDGGAVVDQEAVIDAFIFAASNRNFRGKVFSAVSPRFGVKTDGSGNLLKAYSLFGAQGDLALADAAMTVPITSHNGHSVWQFGSNTSLISAQGNTTEWCTISAAMVGLASGYRYAASVGPASWSSFNGSLCTLEVANFGYRATAYPTFDDQGTEYLGYEDFLPLTVRTSIPNGAEVFDKSALAAQSAEVTNISYAERFIRIGGGNASCYCGEFWGAFDYLADAEIFALNNRILSAYS